MAAKRTGLGRGIGALIPTADQTASRPVDVFFPNSPSGTATAVSPWTYAMKPATFSP